MAAAAARLHGVEARGGAGLARRAHDVSQVPHQEALVHAWRVGEGRGEGQGAEGERWDRASGCGARSCSKPQRSAPRCPPASQRPWSRPVGPAALTPQRGGQVAQGLGEPPQHQHPRRHQQRHHRARQQQQVRQRARRLRAGRAGGLSTGASIRQNKDGLARCDALAAPLPPSPSRPCAHHTPLSLCAPPRNASEVLEDLTGWNVWGVLGEANATVAALLQVRRGAFPRGPAAATRPGRARQARGRRAVGAGLAGMRADTIQAAGNVRCAQHHARRPACSACRTTHRGATDGQPAGHGAGAGGFRAEHAARQPGGHQR